MNWKDFRKYLGISWDVFKKAFKALLGKANTSNSYKYAKSELERIGYKFDGTDDPYNALCSDAILELVSVFSAQGHSGFSASYVANSVNNLFRFKPLSPLTGEDSEWNKFEYPDGKVMFQNRRCFSVFKDAESGQAYDSNGRVFRDKDGSCWTNAESRVDIEFPYVPSTVIVDSESGE